MRWLLLLFSACIPSFEQLECYSGLDCPSGSVCSSGVCVAEDFDGGIDEDASQPDARPDASDAGDASDIGRDAEIEDGAEPDAEEDGGEPDVGVDAGYSIQATPPVIDFGMRPIQCVGPDELATVTNLGVTPVMITGLALAGGTSPAYAIVPTATPFTINPGASRMVGISFLPETTGVHNGRLLVSYFPDPIPETAELTGTGVAATMVTDNFTQGGGPIDILFVVDDTADMMQLQERLATHAIFMMSLLDFENWDYQIGVTSADLGVAGAQGALIGAPPYITRANTVDPQAELETRVLLGEAGNPGNEGLEASRLGLSPPLITVGANAGFLRTNAALLVIYLAKDDDASVMTVSNYSMFLEGTKADATLVQANAIVPLVTACTLDQGGVAFLGDRQIQLASATGGVTSDACGADWLDAMTTLPPVASNRMFSLGFVPTDPNSIVVRVEGAIVPMAGNWTYDAGQNAVVFIVGQEPQLGEQVEITYSAGC